MIFKRTYKGHTLKYQTDDVLELISYFIDNLRCGDLKGVKYIIEIDKNTMKNNGKLF